MKDKADTRNRSARLKDSLVQDMLAQSDEEVLGQAMADGVNPSEARGRVLEALRGAKVRLNSGDKPKLEIDAARARSILRRVAQRKPLDAPMPLLHAAELEGKKDDTEVVEVVAELRKLGVVSDDELK
jgi:hypothetical protein